MHRSFVEKSFIDAWSLNPSLPLPTEVLHRFKKILRVKHGEKIALFDGDGREIQGFLDADLIKQGDLIKEEKQKPFITLWQAALEDTKIAETIQRATEFGVNNIIIFNAERSLSYVFDRLKKRADRMQKISLDASRQSGRFFIPDLAFADTINVIQDVKSPESLGIFGSLGEKNNLSAYLHNKTVANNYYIVIGPEGGLSPAETSCLIKKGFSGTTFGPFVMRAELAALSAISLCNAHCGRA